MGYTVIHKRRHVGRTPAPDAPVVVGGDVFVQQRPMLNDQAAATPTNFYKEFGAHFADGDVPAGNIVEWRLDDGVTVVPSQADNYVTWPSGAIKDISVTMRYPNSLAGHAATTLRGYSKAGSWNNTSFGTTALITARDYRLEIVIGGITYTLRANNEITRGNFRQTRAGQYHCQWRIFGEFRNGINLNDTPQGDIWGFLYIGFYNDGTSYVFGKIEPTRISQVSTTGFLCFDGQAGGNNFTVGQTLTQGAVTATIHSILDQSTTRTLIYDTGTSPFTVGKTVTGQTSGAHGVISAITGPTASAALRVTGIVGNFILNETIKDNNGVQGSGRFIGIAGVMRVTGISGGSFANNAVMTDPLGGSAICDGVRNHFGPQTVTSYAVKDYAGPTTLFSYSTPFILYTGTPIFCCDTDGLHPYTGTSVDKCVVGFPILTLADNTTRGLFDSYNTWWVHSTPAERAAISVPTTSTYIPNANQDVIGGVDAEGGNWWVGPMTRAAAQDMLLSTWASRRADRITALGYSACAGNSFQDPVTGYPANLTHATSYAGLAAPNSTIGWSGTAGSTIFRTDVGGSVSTNWQIFPGSRSGNSSHAALWTWWQYLATGQEWWLDAMQEQPIGILGFENPSTGAIFTRNPLIAGVQHHAGYVARQTRAQAHQTRSYGNARWLTPDNHPVKPYLTDLENSFLTNCSDYASLEQNATAATLGTYEGQDVQGLGGGSAFEHDFWAMNLAMEVRRGFITTSHLLISTYVTPWAMGRVADSGCPYNAFRYRIGFGVGPTPGVGWGAVGGNTYAQTWADVYTTDDFSFGSPTPLNSDGAGGACPLSGLYPSRVPPYVPNTYPQNFQMAAACVDLVGTSSKAAVGLAYLNAVEAATGTTEARWAADCHMRITQPQ